MKHLMVVVLALVCFDIQGAPRPSLEKQVSDLDVKIGSLQKLQGVHEKAQRVYEKKARELQLNRELRLEARHEYMLAESEFDKVRSLQLQILELQTLRDEFLVDLGLK